MCNARVLAHRETAAVRARVCLVADAWTRLGAGRRTPLIQRGWEPKGLVRHMSRRIYERKQRERAWAPVNSREARDKAKAIAAMEADDNLCTCHEGTPSWLCQVTRCYATAAGARCKERRMPRDSCECMGWWDEADGEEPEPTRRFHNETHFDEYGCLPLWLQGEPPPPMPAAGWPFWDPVAEERARRAQSLADLEADSLEVDGWGAEGNPYIALTAATSGRGAQVLLAAIVRAEKICVMSIVGSRLTEAKARLAELQSRQGIATD